MKEYYSIGEFSKMYNISVDILRHYDKIEILKPSLKKNNGYRYYTKDQIWTLNNIRSLREMGVSLNIIKDFLKNRNLQTTMNIIDYQLNIINNDLENILKLKNNLILKKEKLNFLKKEIIFDVPFLKFIQTRNIIKIKGNIKKEEDIDFQIKSLSSNTLFQDNFLFTEEERGVTLTLDSFLKGQYNIYSETFITTNNLSKSNGILKENLFLVLFFKGNYSNINNSYNIIKNFINTNNLNITGDIYEFFHIDIHATINPEEYITEIQVPIKKGTK